MKILKILLPLFIVFALFYALTLSVSASAPIGNYIQLNGGYVKTANNNPVNPSAFSFEAWVRPQSVSGIQKILSVGDKNNQNPNYEIAINGGSISFTYKNGSNGLSTLTAGQIAGGMWSHLAVTVGSGAPNIYLNGTSVFNGVNVTIVSVPQAMGPVIIIGNSYKEPFIGGNPFIGDIDEVRISNTVLDIPSLWSSGTYNSQLTTNNQTILLWHLDESRGSSLAVDVSNNHFDGTLIGADNSIHFFGVLPTPTPWTFSLPTLNAPIWILPTLSVPFINPVNPQPTTNNLQPTTNFDNIRSIPRPTRSFSR